MEKTLYFIRHGQTDLNFKGVVQGRGINSPLNAMGHKQAQAFYEAYKSVPFDKIYTSTLLRTHQTVAPFVADGIPMEELNGLDEISWGVYEGQEQSDIILSGFQDLVSAWKNNNLDQAIDQGESPNQLVLRQKQAMTHILGNSDEKNVLICMHGRALRIMLCHLTEVPVCQMDDFPHTNTALYVVGYKDGKFSVLEYYNTKHLESIDE